MADIVSRIRVEAQGADQAAREIRKLKEAYDQVAQSARGLSADVGSGRGDPFSRATAAGGGALEGGNSPADVEHRESRSRYQREMQSDRERSHQSYNAALRPQGVQQGISTIDDISQGRSASATGGVLSGAGALAGGPLGVGLIAGGIAAMTVQKFADSAFGRLENVFGTGMSQRLNTGYTNVDSQLLGFGRMGIPEGMVTSYFNAAGQSGVDFSKGSTQDATNVAMLAAVSMGVDPSSVAGLVGSLNRANVNANNVSGQRMFGMAEGSFGRPNVGLFTQSLQGMVDTMSGRGIEMTSGSANALSTQMAALAGFGGFSAPGAAAFAQQLQGRGIQAAGVQSAEDIIAFQAMRESGMSVTDTMIAMEENPTEVNTRVLEHLRNVSGGDEDLLRLRVQKYLGAGTTMSQVNRFIETEAFTGNMTQEEIQNRLGAGTNMMTGMDPDTKKAIQTYSAKQVDMLKEFKDSLLDITTAGVEAYQRIFGAMFDFDPLGMGLGGMPRHPGMSTDEISQRVNHIDNAIIEDVGNLTVVVDEAGFSNRRDTERFLRGLEADPNYAASLSVVQTLKTNPEVRGYLDHMYGMAGDHGKRWGRVTDSLSGPAAHTEELAGSWGTIASDLRDSIMNNIHAQHGSNREARGALSRVAANLPAGGIGEAIDLTGLVRVMTEFKDLLARENFVYTDGEYVYRGARD